ncbi:hypothetical protein Nepgr_008230 [Nepenthes gracilis]|uniref:Uncharacterized protein n=1 Tax=Nepenthes gracilis TaxID=150966 RepID=A0AAD3XJ70_NEPGR|nr:hypothetical protein Nepgr_008230 [Nepenthes gracilis]
MGGFDCCQRRSNLLGVRQQRPSLSRVFPMTVSIKTQEMEPTALIESARRYLGAQNRVRCYRKARAQKMISIGASRGELGDY